MKEALGENWSKNDVEMGQTFNKENAAKPLRDTFMLVLNSEVLNVESMGRFYTVSDQKFPDRIGVTPDFRLVSTHKTSNSQSGEHAATMTTY